MYAREAIPISQGTVLAGTRTISEAIRKCAEALSRFRRLGVIDGKKVSANEKSCHQAICDLYENLSAQFRTISKEADYYADECSFIADYYRESYENYMDHVLTCMPESAEELDIVRPQAHERIPYAE